MNSAIRPIWAALLGLALCACATTTLDAVWKDSQYDNRLDKVLVMGVTENETIRKIFEDRFGEELQRYGVTGLSSYRMFPAVEQLDKDAVEEKVRGLGIDAILITRLVNKETVEIRHPETVRVDDYGRYPYRNPYWYSPYYDRWDRYYDRSYDITRTPSYTSEVEVYTLETNLYDMQSGKLVWSALTETFAQGKISENVNDFVEVVTRSLDENGLL